MARNIRKQSIMDSERNKETLSCGKMSLTSEMRIKIRAMPKRSNDAGRTYCPELDVSSMVRTILFKAMAADECLRSAMEKALRFMRKPKAQQQK